MNLLKWERTGPNPAYHMLEVGGGTVRHLAESAGSQTGEKGDGWAVHLQSVIALGKKITINIV